MFPSHFDWANQAQPRVCRGEVLLGLGSYNCWVEM